MQKYNRRTAAQQKKRKYRRRAVTAVSAAAILSSSAVTAFLFTLALDPGCAWFMGKIMHEGHNAERYNQALAPEMKGERAFRANSAAWLSREGRDVYMRSEDGLILHARYVRRAGSHRYAVVCHGYGGQSINMAHVAKRLWWRGFSVLLPDARAHGESQGRYVGMGWKERRDVVRWCKKITAQDPEAEILLFGVSMGAATVLMASGETDLPHQVKAIVEDCGYTSAWEEFASQLKRLLRLPVFPFLDEASLLCSLLAGYGLRQASAEAQVRRCMLPMLFVHGERDAFVPFAMRDRLYDAAPGEKEKLTIYGAAHGQSSLVDPALYWKRVDAFLKKHGLL